jgi:hypothetical protein
MNKKYVVKLTAEERERYERLVHTGKPAAWKIQRAQALLKAACTSGTLSAVVTK